MVSLMVPLSKLAGVRVISLNSEAGVDSGDLSIEDVAELFGTTKGYKAAEPNVVQPHPLLPPMMTSDEIQIQVGGKDR